jgi:hypothetical protein
MDVDEKKNRTVTEDGDACAVLFNVCIESRGCFALDCDMGSKCSYGRFNLLGFLTLVFQHCRVDSTKTRDERGKEVTFNELYFLHLALIRLLFNILSTPVQPLQLCGVCLSTLIEFGCSKAVELCDCL